MKNLGEQIRQLRVAKGMTQGELAVFANSTVSSISNYERGKRTPPYPVLYAMAEVLEVPAAELLKYMVENESSGRDAAAENQVDKRPRRVKRLLAAFDRLSDAAQMEIIEHAEKMVTIPMYRRTLQGILQYYICSRDHLMYQLAEDTRAPKLTGFGSFSGCPDSCSIHGFSRMTFYNNDDPCFTRYCDFFCYDDPEPLEKEGSGLNEEGTELKKEGTELNEEVAKQKLLGILSMLYPEETGYKLGFAFTDQKTLDFFYSSYQDISEDLGPDWMPRQRELPALFLLIDKETCEIKDETYYDPNEY